MMSRGVPQVINMTTAYLYVGCGPELELKHETLPLTEAFRIHLPTGAKR